MMFDKELKERVTSYARRFRNLEISASKKIVRISQSDSREYYIGLNKN